MNEPPVSGNPVGRRLVHADARGARETISQLRGAPCTVKLEELSSDIVELPCRHAGFQGLTHGLQTVGHDTADLF